jgi:MscS family membrane protein
MSRIRLLIFLVLVPFLTGCLEPRIHRNANPERIATLKLFSATAPTWALHYADMPQFSLAEQSMLVTWLGEGKIETNPAEQVKDFAFLSSKEKLLETGEPKDKITIRTEANLDLLARLIPTQFEIYWGNVAPKVVDTLSNESKFSACSGTILTAFENGNYYVLDGHHRWTACLFVRRYLNHAQDYYRAFAPFKYYEERVIYDLLSDPARLKIKTVPDLKVTVLEGNPQGILRILYELAKFGHGHFSSHASDQLNNSPLTYLKRTMFLENPLLQWIYFSLIILSSFIFSRIVLTVLKAKANNKDDTRGRVAIFELIVQTLKKYIYSISFLVFSNFALPLLKMPPHINTAMHKGIAVAVIWLGTIFGARLFSNFMLGWQDKLRTRPDDAELAHLVPLFARIGKIMIYFMGLLVIMNRVGYNIYSAVAGLGVGGFALAMAGREAVGHIFSGVSLYVDKVIKEGDYVLLDPPVSTWGRVEKVGMRSTQIRTKYNSILVMPNSVLANNPVNNITAGGRKRMYRGRILLAHGTEFSKMEMALVKMREITERHQYTAQVDIHFMKFDAFGFYIRIQYFVEPYTEYHDTVSKINLEILQYLNSAGITVAADLAQLRKK